MHKMHGAINHLSIGEIHRQIGLYIPSPASCILLLFPILYPFFIPTAVVSRAVFERGQTQWHASRYFTDCLLNIILI